MAPTWQHNEPVEPHDLKNIIIRQTAALESAVTILIGDRQAMFEVCADKNGQIPDDRDRLEILRFDTAIQQCQAAIVSGRAVQRERS